MAHDLKRGQEILKAISHINSDLFKDPIVSMGAKKVTASLVDLMSLLSNRSGQDVASLGTFLNDAFKKYMEGEITDEEAEKVLRMVNAYLETYTPGMSSALGKIKYKGVCRACGFNVPSYPGAYPKFCPNCGSPFNLSNVKIETFDKLCPKCEKIHDSVFEVCGDCGSDLYPLSNDLIEVYSAILEVYYLMKATPKVEEKSPLYDSGEMYEMLSNSKIPIRRKNLIDESKDNEELIADILRMSSIKNYEMDEKYTVESVVKFLSSLDKYSLASLFPFINEIEQRKFTGIFKGLYSDMMEKVYEVRSAVNVLLNNKELFSSESYEDLSVFLETFYRGLIHNITPEKDSSYYAKFAEDTLGYHLDNIREEVKQRRSLLSAVKSLEGKFNIDTALKTYSTCFTRVVIESERTDNASLRAFRETVLEYMQKLFNGRFEESVNFIKGVFLGG